ncbi:YciI family protein [Terrabacter sp. MAHUQ-38]|uniref:YciI family protein n=1 Tax=unclassified Terrabacter TaxID=2630222 RepID=UPI00165E82EC|nr:YciI family protein [Terrabacter sp. MAHUQ-38]MBC9820497.1 hypothetical protein [Terrabacter sp. MAHUQ-38]
MQFLVLGKDGPDFVYEPHELHEAHWAYMDEWTTALIARGPTLSPDGADHTGSVHVVDLGDATLAQRFALDEPYARAGWYSEVSVIAMQPCVDGTMWDRPTPAAQNLAAFVRADIVAERTTEHVADTLRRLLAESDDPQWLYAGAALSEDRDRAVGLVGLVDRPPESARQSIEAFVLATTGCAASGVECHRWQRGGRPD